MTRTSILAFFAEFGPLVAFFIAGRLTDFFTAVGILMIATVIAVSTSWLLDKRIPWLPVISACFVLLGGCITLSYRAPDAIIFADTLYYLTVATALGYTLFRKQLLFKILFHTVFAISDDGWRALCWRWFWFLLLAAVANEIARHYLTPEAWIDYRFYKSIVITIFALLQFSVAIKYRTPENSTPLGLRIR